MKTTFVRVATTVAEPGAPVLRPPAAGELRIVGVPASRAAAVERVREVSAASAGAAVTGFSLADLEALSAREGITLRALLEELRAAGLELVAEAPMDRLQDPRRSSVNIAGSRSRGYGGKSRQRIDAAASCRRSAARVSWCARSRQLPPA